MFAPCRRYDLVWVAVGLQALQCCDLACAAQQQEVNDVLYCGRGRSTVVHEGEACRGVDYGREFARAMIFVCVHRSRTVSC